MVSRPRPETVPPFSVPVSLARSPLRSMFQRVVAGAAVHGEGGLHVEDLDEIHSPTQVERRRGGQVVDRDRVRTGAAIDGQRYGGVVDGQPIRPQAESERQTRNADQVRGIGGACDGRNKSRVGESGLDGRVACVDGRGVGAAAAVDPGIDRDGVQEVVAGAAEEGRRSRAARQTIVAVRRPSITPPPRSPVSTSLPAPP